MLVRFLAAWVIFAGVIAGIAGALLKANHPDWPVVELTMFVYWGSSVLCLALGAGPRLRLVLKDDLRWQGRQLVIRGMLAGVAVYGCATLVVIAIAGLLLWLAPEYLEDILRRLHQTYSLGSGRFLADLIYLFFGCVFAPFVEEVFFRGLVFRRWQAKWGAVRAALLSSAWFALLHPAILPQFCFALLSCVLVVRFGSLWPSIAMHVVNNSMCTAVELLTRGDTPSAVALTSIDRGGVAWIVAGLPCAIWGVRYFVRNWHLLRESRPLHQFTDAGIPGRIAET